jgi:hypothetical protein
VLAHEALPSDTRRSLLPIIVVVAAAARCDLMSSTFVVIIAVVDVVAIACPEDLVIDIIACVLAHNG